jgi:hypothetical protein
MSYSSADARAQILSELAAATEHVAATLAALGDAYEWLDEQSADRLEEQLFRPAQRAYGRAQRTYAEFAERYGLPARRFEPAGPSGRPGDTRGALARAGEGLHAADATLATLQDSMLPVDVGDPALRAGLAEVRELIGPLPGRAREFVRTFGR